VSRGRAGTHLRATQQDKEILVIPDRIIESGTLIATGSEAAVEVRIPWYRALPGSCISEVVFAIDGIDAPADTLRWTMNGKTFSLPDLAREVDEWWFPVDSAIVSGHIPIANDCAEHKVDIALKLYIPYIVTVHGVLRIEERDSKTMRAVRR
jgi:hypothetical protein